MKKMLLSIVLILAICGTADARNPRTISVSGTWDGDEGAVFKARDAADATVNFTAGTAVQAAQQIVTALNAAGGGWSASRVGTLVTVSQANGNQIKIRKVNIRNASTFRCAYQGHCFESDELLELQGYPEGGTIGIQFPGPLGLVTAPTDPGMSLDDAMMSLEMALNELIPDMYVSFGVDIEDGGQIFMPLDRFDLIGEDVSALEFYSTDPGLALEYAPCPEDVTPTTKSSWGSIKSLFSE